MGQCPCWGSRNKRSYIPYIHNYDEDYQEFESASRKDSFSTYRPPVVTASHTGPVNSAPTPNPESTPSSDTHTYQPPEIPPPSHPLESPPLEQPQYTQFTESVFLSRPNQPTDSMMLDSMMGSTILGNPDDTILGSNPGVPNSPLSDSPASSVYYDASSTSFMANSVYTGAFEPPDTP